MRLASRSHTRAACMRGSPCSPLSAWSAAAPRHPTKCTLPSQHGGSEHMRRCRPRLIYGRHGTCAPHNRSPLAWTTRTGTVRTRLRTRKQIAWPMARTLPSGFVKTVRRADINAGAMSGERQGPLRPRTATRKCRGRPTRSRVLVGATRRPWRCTSWRSTTKGVAGSRSNTSLDLLRPSRLL